MVAKNNDRNQYGYGGGASPTRISGASAKGGGHATNSVNEMKTANIENAANTANAANAAGGGAAGAGDPLGPE